jgi:hypothetical protein
MELCYERSDYPERPEHTRIRICEVGFSESGTPGQLPEKVLADQTEKQADERRIIL